MTHSTIGIELSPAFQTAFPHGVFGVLIASGCRYRLRAMLIDVDQRERFLEDAIDADPMARAYAGYFRRYRRVWPLPQHRRPRSTSPRQGSA